jgi:hypothetical protein
MKQLEVKKVITYRWWRGDKKEIQPSNVDELKEHADERIGDMMRQGFTSGELHACSKNGVEYSGHWDVKDGNQAGG